MTEDKGKLESRIKEIKESIPAREKAFNAELMPILKRYNFTFGSQAMLSPDGRIMSRPLVMDPELMDLEQKLMLLLQGERSAPAATEDKEPAKKKKGKKEEADEDDEPKQL